MSLHPTDITKHLYNLMAKLTGGISANSLPEIKSDKDLSEEFEDFFLLKILKSRENLDKYKKISQIVQAHCSVWKTSRQSLN